LDLKNYEIAIKLERQNGAKSSFFLKNGHIGRRESLEIVAVYLLFNLYFR